MSELDYIEGNVGREAEEKEYQGKNGPASLWKFSIRAKISEGQEEWVNVACFSGSTKRAARNLRVGQRVRIYGELVHKEYNGKMYYNLERVTKIFDPASDQDLSMTSTAELEDRITALEKIVEKLMLKEDAGSFNNQPEAAPMPNLDDIPF